MGRFLAPLAVLTALTSLASAGIQITKPKAGDKLTAGESIKVEWKEAGSGPTTADLTTYQAWLCAGPNKENANTYTFPINLSGDFAKGGSSTSVLIPETVGANSPANAYYVKMLATAAKGGTYTIFSDRFSYSGMTGSFLPALATDLKAVSGTDGPADVDATVADAADPSNVAADEDFEVEYTMQTGATRYAPMQPVPPTKITAKTAKPQYPTSSVAIAKTKLPIPSVQTTVTRSQTHKVSSIENTVAAAPMPSDDMAKFLRRWQD